jgi:hypothetical protein
MFESNVPKFLWGDAVLTASYLINRMPTRVLNYLTPLNVFKNLFPTCRLHADLPLKVFGCTVLLIMVLRAADVEASYFSN